MTDVTYSLCQDCLRLNPTHEGGCKCGGETCSCSDCTETIKQLINGCLEYKTLGLKKPIQSWNAKTGTQ
ncbi:hypothetical protein [Priestia megaterium]|uniref:hypothetical protein n=1 Tax=Priestia megaterium TaxID=1404 RepID=UPI000BF2E252|nr:hypothetical protein [Priestia megaterium]PFQ82043.1 hypothetical protein COK11_16315 [Priestia megaterium]